MIAQTCAVETARAAWDHSEWRLVVSGDRFTVEMLFRDLAVPFIKGTVRGVVLEVESINLFTKDYAHGLLEALAMAEVGRGQP